MPTQKLQYYPDVLAKHLGVGKIHEMHVAEEDGKPVLRIVCDEKEEYRTVGAAGVKKKAAGNGKPQQRQGQPKTLQDKVGAGLKSWWNNKKKPDWME